MNEIELAGCQPVPLASYLKSLGILRLISSEANHVCGKAADPQARGMWRGERFWLETSLDEEELLQFFLQDYAPSPIIAPWNGGSGFYGKDSKEGMDPLSQQGVAKRFEPVSQVVVQAQATVKSQKLKESPKNEAKQDLISRFRSELPDLALVWLDAVLVLAEDSLSFPPLLGTGGNDGRLEFTNNFMCHLVSRRTNKHHGLFDVKSGMPRGEARPLLESAFFELPSKDYVPTAIGQYAPGEAGGLNATSGYEGDSNINPWDFVFLLEGAVSFAGAATRRHQSELEIRSGSRASFPFTVDAVGVGWGGIGTADEENARAEFWAPLWERPAKFGELETLFSEGRAVLNGKTAQNGLDFARAAKSLGVSRGVSHFQRYGFLMRSGRSYFATPMARHKVTNSVSEVARLVSDCDKGGWLGRLRRLRRADGTPTSANNSISQFEDALMSFLQEPDKCVSAQQVLVALGEMCSWLSRSSFARKEAKIPPPPKLKASWIKVANDDTPEFRIAAALAGLGLASAKKQSMANGAATEAVDLNMDGDPDQSTYAALPMATHFAPVDGTVFSGYHRWLEDSSPTVVWSAGDLVTNMARVLERRMVEKGKTGMQDKPLDGPVPARLGDVVCFLEGDFDDKRCAALISGLIWVRPNEYLKMKSEKLTAPFAYAALKPLFVPDRTLRRLKVLDDKGRMPIPPGMITRLKAARSAKEIDEQVRRAFARFRASGLSSPFAASQSGGRNPGRESSLLGVGIAPRRLAAALLIPMDDWALERLLKQSYRSS